MELTKEHFDQALRALATQHSVDELAARMTAIEQLLGSQATALDVVAKNTADWHAEMAVMRNRQERYEQALKVVGQKLNLDMDALLH